MRTRVLICCLAVLIGMTGCPGGFVVKEPPQENIMSIRNSLQATAVRDPATSIPFPTPNLPADKAPPPAPSASAPATAGSPKAIGQVTLADVNTPPFDNFAKLAFMQGADFYSCTAEFVGDSNDVIMTAGHCVYSPDSNTWNSDWNAYTKYDRGNYLTRFNWECAAVYSGWAQNYWPADFAFIKVRGTNPTALGLRGAPLPSEFKSVGYPVNYFGAAQLVQVDGVKGEQGGVVRMLNNPFSHGSSGGAWLDQNVAIGLNSYNRTDDPNSMWGPQFGPLTIALYEFVRRGCVDEVPAGAVKIETQDKERIVVSPGTTAQRYGPSIKYSSSSGCDCPDSRFVALENKSGNRYVARYKVLTYGDGTPERAEEISTEILPEETRPLACTIEKVNGKCDIHRSWILSDTRRISGVKDKSGFIGVQSVTPDFCAQMCAPNAPTGYCLPVGSLAKPVLQPLAAFVTDVLNRKPTKDGVVATVDDMVTKFGGDPKVVGNPCGRSSFFRLGERVLNEGMECTVTTAALDQSPTALRFTLASPTQTHAVRVDDAGQPTSSQAFFESHATSPVLKFEGPANADELNSLFGGTVIAVQRDGQQLIVTTENGCVRGEP
jgi:hypothetical protein